MNSDRRLQQVLETGRKEGRKRGQETKATGQNIPRSPRINYALVSDSTFLIEGVQSVEAHDDLLPETM